MAEDEFRSLCRTKGLKDKTIEKLLEEDIDSEDVLAIVENKEPRFEALGITMGQAGLIRRWVDDIKQQKETEAPTNTSGQKQTVSTNDPENPIPPTAETPVTREAPDGEEEYVVEFDIVHPDELKKTIEPGQSVDLHDRITNLNAPDKFREKIAEHFETHGVEGLDNILEGELKEFMNSAVNIAIIGRSGTGKSSLINCLRNLRAFDEGAAKVGPTETTKVVTPYVHPAADKVTLWDLPGVNTPQYPRETYLEKVMFSKYDAFIIVCTDRVSQDDIWLAREADLDEAKRPFYFVRTKIDEVVQNNKRDAGKSEPELLEEMRVNIRSELENAKLPSDNVFLVSSILTKQANWDFPRLTHLLVAQTPMKSRSVMVLAMISCSKESIASKKEELSGRIEAVAIEASTADSGEPFKKIIIDEVKVYTERFGVTDADFEKWQVDLNELNPKLRKIKKALDLMLWPLKVKTATLSFLSGAVGSMLALINMDKQFKDYIKDLTQKAENAKHTADQKTSELKRLAAQKTLTLALNNCEKLALGVLEIRKNDKEDE